MNSRCPESAEDAGSRNQSQTRHLRAKAGPELAAGGRTRPGLSAERGGGGCEARPLETPGNRPPAAGAPAPAGRSAARCCQVAAFSGSHRSTLRPPGIQAGLASRVPEPARAPPPRTPGSFSARARGPFPSCGGQGADSGGAETEGLAAAGTTEARDSGPAVAGTCARSCRCGGPEARSRQGMGGWEGASSADRVRLQRKGSPRRQAPAQPAAESGGRGLERWGQGWWAGGWRGGGICPPELSGPLSGRGSDPGDRNRARGAVTR